MKAKDVFCASPASTAICVSSNSTTNMDQSSFVRHGGRAIDRHNPHLRDGRRRSRINPTTTTTTTTTTNNHLSVPSSPSLSQSQPQPARKPTKPPQRHCNSSKSKAKTSSSANKQLSPPGSARYLLSDTSSFLDVLTEFEPLPSSSSTSSLVPSQQPTTRSWDVISDKYPAFQPTTSPSSSSSSTSSACNNDHQVVVLRVSLHCKGCEGKVRKHLSNMKGVTSFNIDFSMKKVTVIGDVTPLGVLASISRVKNAQFWPSLSSSSSLKSSTHHRHLNLTN